MTDEQIHQELITRLADLDETYVLQLVKRLLDDGEDPLPIIEDCEQAMTTVGDRYERREYYLSGLIMAGEIFREVMALTQPFMEQRLAGNSTGRILLGTVQHDIHDIGKGIFAIALRCYGFTVDDLGVDVPPQRFLERVQADPPDIVGLSGLITLSYDSMKETIQLIREHSALASPAIPIVIGGGTLTERVAHYVGADYWKTDAMDGVRICQQIMQKQTARSSEA
ncbi:MAG: cobalamin-dependent protein [Chloroflexi bacterium]|nr:cobalamin-dependent protein [Chloroflexota bacterium]